MTAPKARFVVPPILGVVLAASLLASATVRAADSESLTATEEALVAAQADLEKLDAEIEQWQGSQAGLAQRAALIAKQVARLQAQETATRLALKRTELTAAAVADERAATAEAITALAATLAQQRAALRELVRDLYRQEQASLVRVFMTTGSLSAVVHARAASETIQAKTQASVATMRETAQALAATQAALAEQAEELRRLAVLKQAQADDLADQQQTQNNWLRATEDEQLHYERKLKEARSARDEIAKHIYTLKHRGVQVALTDARAVARFAGDKTGVRPALILAVLKVESNLGSRIGSGTFPDDMHPDSREAYARLLQKLGLAPAQAPIAARPANGAGWGGAMGPAQIMPQTWEAIEARLATLLGKTVPNPYELTDAFMATALLLADKGAAGRAREAEAVARYIAGPYWERYTWYSERVLAVAEEYEKEGI